MSGSVRPTARTRVFALLGDPVSHSLSPLLQNAAFASLGLDGVYVVLRCAGELAPALVVSLARAGGGGNITVPHKTSVLDILERTTDAVGRTGACNTFWAEDGRICGDNTDVHGFRAALHALVGDAAGARILVVGAGGAARAVIAALLYDGVEHVLLHNRTHARAAELVARFDDPRLRIAATVDGVDADIVINATSMGLHARDPLPVDLDRLPRARFVLDLVYAPGSTPLVRAARERGLDAADGTEMLVQQGAAAFERWWGREAPVAVMRRALADAAAENPSR